MELEKNKLLFILLIFFIIPATARAADLDNLKADFLRGNYRRVIFEAQAQADRTNAGSAEELNYLLGLSYLKEGKLEQAQECFKRILSASSDKFKAPANLGLADTYLMAGRFQDAQDIYDKLASDDPGSRQKAAVLYRLSQLEFKKGNLRQGNDYLSELKREFPLSPELRLAKSLSLIHSAASKPRPLGRGKNTPLSVSILSEPRALARGVEGLITPPVSPLKDTGGYSVQVGFFTSSDNASKLKNKLLAENYPAYLEDSGAGYRVRVGKFKSQQEVSELESRLSQQGFQTKICP